MPRRVTVRRGRVELAVDADDLVPGDLLLLQEGDRIAADVRLTRATDLLVNNAPLTGESRLQALIDHVVTVDFRDSPNLACAGCQVIRGSGEGVVFATGVQTEFGHIAVLSRQTRRPCSPLERDVRRLNAAQYADTHGCSLSPVADGTCSWCRLAESAHRIR